MDRSDVANPKALPQMNISWTQSRASMVAMGSTGMAVAHTPVKMDSPDTPSGVVGTLVAGDRQEYMKVLAGKLEVACTSLEVDMGQSQP
jgi:hypothetical protein